MTLFIPSHRLVMRSVYKPLPTSPQKRVILKGGSSTLDGFDASNRFKDCFRTTASKAPQDITSRCHSFRMKPDGRAFPAQMADKTASRRNPNGESAPSGLLPI